MLDLKKIQRNNYNIIFWCLHICLFVLFFHNTILSPNDWMLHAREDGLKNYFTLQSYLQQPASDGYFRFTGMQYPYGDYIWYTDNSPLFAIILRFVQLNITDVAPYSVAIFNWLMLLNMLIAPFVLLSLIRKFIKSEWLVVVGALIILYTSPQFPRLFTGTMNLSLSVFYFCVFALLIDMHHALHSGDMKKVVRKTMLTCVVIFAAALIHLYYLILLGLPFVAVIAGHFFIFKIRRTNKWWLYALPGLGVVVTTGLILFIVQSTDAFFSLRPEQLDGSVVQAWSSRMFHLYVPRKELNAVPFFGGKLHYDHENGAYLGAFFWYVLIGSVLLLTYAQLKHKKLSLKVGRLALVFILSAVIAYFTSAGMFLYVHGKGIVSDNYLNPLYYVSKIYPAIENFRCIGRMSWWLFYCAQFGILIIIDRFVFPALPKAGTILVCIGIILTALDLSYYYRYAQNEYAKNIFSEAELNAIPEINTDGYQAILPMPFYMVGSEDYAITLDDNSLWSSYTYQLQLKTGLPLMSVKLARSPQLYAEQYAEMLKTSQIPVTMAEHMNDQPVLVVVDTAEKYVNQNTVATNGFKQSSEWRSFLQPHAVDSVGTKYFYSWDFK